MIYPPVDVRKIQGGGSWQERLSADDERILSQLPPSFLLGASRFVPYKRLDDVIRAGRITGFPVVIAGDGPDEPRLRSLARESGALVHFVIRPSDELLYSLYERCHAYVFPAIEDFGIMPVEAMAAGAAVIANRTGGAAESVVDGVTGRLVDFASPADLSAAAAAVADAHREAARTRALEFDVAEFELRIRRWVTEGLNARVAQ
ncbi:hypothetical protein GCM10009808_00170 [Microbacterium sediminicola]|uniref:Glycosyl transferase family 1 domain-containing protein n=1 Tax=Microbacterium sediminicola TaxID=415210 RepID=A0ABP4TFD4_9MICO